MLQSEMETALIVLLKIPSAVRVSGKLTGNVTSRAREVFQTCGILKLGSTALMEEGTDPSFGDTVDG